MEWIIQLIVAASVVTHPSPNLVNFAQSLPPLPQQSSLKCRDAAWESTHLSGVAGDRLHTKLAPYVTELITKARSEGVGMSISTAYRNCEYQLQLRSLNCGLGEYNLYKKPSAECTPPTEAPGRSMHNEGLAIDFSCDGYNIFEYSPCFPWLKQHAKTYHLRNHSVEPWHWSTTGV